jgi:hypothetical protein
MTNFHRFSYIFGGNFHGSSWPANKAAEQPRPSQYLASNTSQQSELVQFMHLEMDYHAVKKNCGRHELSAMTNEVNHVVAPVAYDERWILELFNQRCSYSALGRFSQNTRTYSSLLCFLE